MPGYTFGPFYLDTESRILERNGEPLPLTGKTLDALLLLVQNRGRALTKDELMSSLWPGTVVEEANLTQAIFTLRKLLGDSPKDHRYIATLPGRGYQFVAPASESQNVKEAVPHHNRWFSIAALVVIAISGLAAWRIIVARNIGDADSAMHVVPFTNLLGYAHSPQFSPDGNAMAFSWSPEDRSTSSIYVKMVGSNTELQLSTPPGWDDYPAWSPDGRQIAFCRDLDGHSKYYTVSALGGPPREAFHSELSGCSVFAWLDDGKHLVLRQESSPLMPGAAFEERGNHAARLVSVDLASGSISPLTSPPSNQIGDQDPAVSPDGKIIAFIRREGTNVGDIFWVPASGGETHRLTNYHSEIWGLAWTPDNRKLVFAMTPWSKMRLLRTGIANHKTESILSSTDLPAAPGQGSARTAIQVTKDGGFDALESSDGKYLYFAKGRGKLGLWRKQIAGGFESPEEAVLPSLQHWGWWALGKTGVFYFEAPPKPNATVLVKYLSFASGKIQEIGRLRKVPAYGNPVVTVSPDERFLVYEHPEQIGSNIVLVENFR